MSALIFKILLEGNGEFFLLKIAIVVCPLGFVQRTPPLSVPNHLLSAPSTTIELIVWLPNRRSPKPFSSPLITTGCAFVATSSKTPDALLYTTNPDLVPNQILLLLSTAIVLTFKSGKFPSLGAAIKAFFRFPFSL